MGTMIAMTAAMCATHALLLWDVTRLPSRTPSCWALPGSRMRATMSQREHTSAMAIHRSTECSALAKVWKEHVHSLPSSMAWIGYLKSCGKTKTEIVTITTEIATTTAETTTVTATGTDRFHCFCKRGPLHQRASLFGAYLSHEGSL